MIPKKELEQIKEELIECQNPFFFFHDDPDGLCSFLLLYRFKGEGKFHIVKNRPIIEENFIRFVPEECDKVFVLDIAMIEQGFADKIKKPVVWIDHHAPQKLSKVKYFNPRIKKPDEYTAVSAICYKAINQDLLIGALGTIGDLSKQTFLSKFFKEYKSLIGNHRDLFDITFKTKFGKLIRIIEFNLAGKTKDIKKSLVIFSKTKNFTDFLEPKTEEQEYVLRKYEEIDKEYQEVLKEGMKFKKDEPYVYVYKEGNVVFGGELGKEIPYRIPGKKVYIIAREKGGRMLCSLRSKKINLVEFLKKAFHSVDGFGGGHPVAAGCSVRKEDFDKFVELAREAI